MAPKVILAISILHPQPSIIYKLGKLKIHIISYNIASPQVLDKFFAQDFGLACARAWPLADKESLRLLIDWFTLLFSYDDLLDDSSTGLMADQSGTADFSKILIAAIRDEDFTPTERLPVATAYRECVLPTQLAGKIFLSFVFIF